MKIFDLDIFEWMVIGPLNEDLADEEERRRLEDDLFRQTEHEDQNDKEQ